MADYIVTADPEVITKVVAETSEINLAEFAQRYLTLKAEYLALPKLKTVPDQDTLDVYNNYVIVEVAPERDRIKAEAKILYYDLKAIKDLGLLPSKYDDEFAQLEAFVNS